MKTGKKKRLKGYVRPLGYSPILTPPYPIPYGVSLYFLGVDCILRIAHKFDLDFKTPANGYRSMVKTVHKCCIKILQLIRYINTNRTSFLFRSGHYRYVIHVRLCPQSPGECPIVI